VSFSLPYSRRRRYLTGMDWVIGALHRDACQGGGGRNRAGALSQIVLSLNGRLDDGALRGILDAVGRRLPLIQGRVARDGINLAPYWKIPRVFRPELLPLRVVELPAAAAAESERLFSEHVNTPLSGDSQHLSFLLVRLGGGGQSRLGMVFDHRLLDAWGAEAFVHLVNEAAQGRLEEAAAPIRQTEPAHLDRWPARFKAGRVLGEMFARLGQEEACALAPPPFGASRRVAFVHDCLSAEESARFLERAEEEIGVPILLPAAAARAVLAVRRALPTMPLPGSRHLVFTTVSTRPPGREREALFFNPFAFLPFVAPTGSVPPAPAELAAVLRDQFFDLMRREIPQAMQDATALGRICPLGLLGEIMRRVGGGRVCTLYFACLRDSGYAGDTFMGLPVEDLRHTPRAFSPPGLNLCMTWFRDHFNLVLAYVEGSLNAAAAQVILREFKALLQ
jgi:hypothetical protein